VEQRFVARLVRNQKDSILRVLVVEDHASFRKLICSTLKKKWNVEHIFEASDGFEAVKRTEELRPDLILLDIGLPTLSGIQAARHIREFSTKSKILFLTMESSDEAVQEAFRSGANGYVVKSKLATELLTAVDTVLRGEQFLGSGLKPSSLLESVSSSEYENKLGAEA
jgi:DNA-binding NarL/FixJ family response regulator